MGLDAELPSEKEYTFKINILQIAFQIVLPAGTPTKCVGVLTEATGTISLLDSVINLHKVVSHGDSLK